MKIDHPLSVANGNLVKNHDDLLLPLNTPFPSRGFRWSILERRGDMALVSQTDPKTKTLVAYNVIKLMQPRVELVNGEPRQLSERLPGWEAWGTRAWNYGRDYDRASEAFIHKTV